MKRRWIFILLFAWLLPIVAHAQSNPPFQNPSLDSNCYFPQIGVPGEIDTIVGTSGEGLGDYIHNLGPQPNGSYGNMFIGNGEGYPLFVNEAPTGPNFNLHDLHAIAQNLKLNPNDLRFGHFHNSSSVDIFAYNRKIYWADKNGNYDSAHYTQLKSNNGGFVGDDFGAYYIANLSSDTVDDIVAGLGTFDSNYLGYFKGGTSLFNKSVAYEDTSVLIPPPYGYQTFHSNMQGDFRGTGRDDLLITDYFHNLFFFKNDPPFTLEKLVHAMQYDTLWTKPSRLDTITYRNSYSVFSNVLSMHALPKKKGDSSYDWLVWVPTLDSGNGIYIFRGGPAFGSHRITLDSAAYIITQPQLGYPIWPGVLSDAGDMTGTGNHLLYTGGGAGGAGGYVDQNYYVTGEALDNKIDIFYCDCAAGLGDTLTANADSLEDLLLGSSVKNTMWLVYGSKSIPVHLNPEFSDVKVIPQQNGAGISFSPNPATRGWSVATIVWPVSENGEYSIYDMLGRMVAHGAISLYGGAEQQRIYFSGLAAGVYIYSITGAHDAASAKIVKLGGTEGSGTPQPSFIQQLKQARDEPEVSNGFGLQVK